MLNQSLSTPIAGSKISPAPYALPAIDQFGAVTGNAGLIATEFAYKKEEEIYGEDEPSEYVYQVISGAVHRLAAEAIIDTTVRLVKRRSLEQAAGVDVKVARNLWTMTAGDLRHAEDHMLLLGRKTAMERVATFLLEMDRRLSVTGMMALPMCRRDIGDYLGLTLETVSRALSQLHAQGVLGFSGARQIVLRNRARLRNMDA